MKKLYFILCFSACALTPLVPAQEETEVETPVQADSQTQSVLPPFLSAAVAAGLDPRKLQWYDGWVTQYPNDAPPEAFIDDPVELKRVRGDMENAKEESRQAIRKDAEILPYLKALFWLHHRAPENNGTGGVKSILEAMTLKAQLSEADVADIAAEVDRILALPFSGRDGDRNNYLLSFYAETIIRRFPSKINLDRCVKIVNVSDNSDWFSSKAWTLKVLTEVGTADTVESAEQALQWFEARRSIYTETRVNAAKRQVEAMRRRLGSTVPTMNFDGGSSRIKVNDAVSTANPPPATETPPVPSLSSQNTRLNPLWIALGLLPLPVIFLLLRKKT